MKNILITISKIALGILFIIIPFKIIAYLFSNVILIQDYTLLKWVALLICFLGFYISGLINRKTPLKFIPLLYISLLLFIPIGCFYFPLIYFLFLFATISLLLTRKEFSSKIKWASLVLMSGLFIYFLFSQPLIIAQGNKLNGKTIWDFSSKKSNLLPESIFLDSKNNSFDLKSFKNKTLYISFWATWCKPCLVEKPELDKLKADFKSNPNIVFIDISIDGDKDAWGKYLEKNKPNGIQLISKNEGKTRSLFELSGIPAHLAVNSKWEFAKERTVKKAYNLLSDSVYLNDFINRKLPKDINSANAINIEDYRFVKYAEVDSIKSVYYTTDGKNRFLAPQINSVLDTIRKKQNVKFTYLQIEKKPIQNIDSIIYNVMIVSSNMEMDKLNE